MIFKYLATLAIVVVTVTLAVAGLQFATNSQVLAGKALDENLSFEFTIDADNDNYWKIDPEMVQYLQTHIAFPAEGALHVVSAKVAVTPERVSWTEHKTKYTAPGAAMTVQLRWDTPAASANGSRGLICLDIPQVAGLATQTATLHSGPYQVDGAGRTIIRQATAYRSALLVTLARFGFALAAGLPFGILLHTLGWAFVLRGEKRRRLAELSIQNEEWPRTFYPSPIAEWVIWLLIFGIGAFVPGMMAGISVADGFLSYLFVTVIFSVLAVATAVATLVVYLTGKNLLTVRVAPEGISWARGRENPRWSTAAWGEISSLIQKSRTYRGTTSWWIEIEFQDSRKKLRISQSIVGYPALRDLLMSRAAG